jgi:hypothetical protein
LENVRRPTASPPPPHHPLQAKQLKEWGAEGVICGSALVKALGESGSPGELAGKQSGGSTHPACSRVQHCLRVPLLGEPTPSAPALC